MKFTTLISVEGLAQFIDEPNWVVVDCRFALDDFGVGFTSFIYLREMHVDFIKIDGTFIRRLHKHRHDQGIVKAIITVARDMKIKTIAEFVEQEETLHLLKEFEVDYAQGFFIGKPAPTPILKVPKVS